MGANIMVVCFLSGYDSYMEITEENRQDTMDIKQVIVMRKDLKMRRGKEIAQGAHASMTFIVKRLEFKGKAGQAYEYYEPLFSKAEYLWMENSFKKVTLQVNSEQELIDINTKAQQAGLLSYIITDAGLTEFNGVPTMTCLAIGPDDSEKIDAITGELELY